MLSLVFVLSPGLVYAGSHLITAIRGDDGMVPVAARWRFVGLVSVLVTLGTVGYLVGPVTVGSLSATTVLGALGVGGVLAYWVYESRAGYRDAVET